MSEQLFQNDRLFRTLLDNLSDGVYFTDTQRRIQYWNKGAETITGYSAGEVQGHCCADNILMHTDMAGQCLCQGHCPLAATIQDCESRSAKLFLHHKDGHRVPILVSVSPIRDENGAVIGGLETFHDITTEMSALQQVEELMEKSLLCPVTGVGNRRYTEQMLTSKGQEMKRSGSSLGLVFVDVDHFKAVNDRFGHKVGDVALKMVARTLSGAMRSYDFLGRWGGEEFIAILPNLHRPQLEVFAERLRALVEKSSATVSNGALVVTISAGATVVKAGEEVGKAVARADALMYKSKAQGRNRVTIG
ncbi:MAG: sensor domain-containing diguanylate cyclase [Candidatus Hydrogenedentes bacterium]|nr:sensor domain-containing diguanylate cyclase [Candidatus Hydrogenedentota bacterium]